MHDAQLCSPNLSEACLKIVSDDELLELLVDAATPVTTGGWRLAARSKALPAALCVRPGGVVLTRCW